MKRLILLAAAALAALPAFGQEAAPPAAKPPAASAGPYGPDKAARPDARQIRAEREKCVARTGAAARRLVEEHGPAVSALNACTPAIGKNLAEAYDAGVLDKLKVDDLLNAVAAGGTDDAALWMIRPEHAAELQDPDACGAFCAAPVDAALGIRKLPEMAAEYRARRLENEQADEQLAARMKQARDAPKQPAAANASQEVAAWGAALGFIGLILAVLYAARRWAGGGKQSYPVARREA